jgi:hypothetical protein
MLREEMEQYMEKDVSKTVDKIQDVSAAIFALNYGNNHGIERTFLKAMGITNKKVRACFRGDPPRRNLAESLFNDYKASI